MSKVTVLGGEIRSVYKVREWRKGEEFQQNKGLKWEVGTGRG